MPDSPDLPSDGTAPADPSRVVAQPRPGDNADALSVSAVSAALKQTVEDRFGNVRVRGELSGVKRAASGHVYLCLKDDRAVLDGVMWKGGAARLAFAPEDGLEVIASGKLTTYAGRSKYQIVIDSLEIAGEGALMVLFEKMKARLREEGHFDRPSRPLPFIPRTIGVVTSPTGSVIRDILHRLEDRCPSHVVVWPVPVQGEGAGAKIADAITAFGALSIAGEIASGGVARPDLIIVARGGGSIEDLWCFNEEAVVRAVAGSPIPVISAVGHETDTTLCDLAADYRAPTPTAAAEMAVPVRADLLSGVRDLGLRGDRAARRLTGLAGERLSVLVRAMPVFDRLFAPQRQRLDELAERNRLALRGRHRSARERFERANERLTPALLTRIHRRDADRLTGYARMLTSLDPRRLLAKGYAMVTDAAGNLVASAAAAGKAARLHLQFADGGIDVAPAGEAPPPTPSPGPRRATVKENPPVASKPGQGSLF